MVEPLDARDENARLFAHGAAERHGLMWLRNADQVRERESLLFIESPTCFKTESDKVKQHETYHTYCTQHLDYV